MAGEQDKLASIIADSLNKGTKGNKVAYFLDDEDSPSEVNSWVSTGSSILDMIISNKKEGGLPVGKIVEVHGVEGSGKSLVAAHVLANTQKAGGIPVYIDTENAVNFDFLQTIGIDKDKPFVYVSENQVEKIFAIIENIITTVKEKSKGKNDDRFVTILVDSVAGATTENEIEGDYDKEGWNTDKAIVLSKSMRKLTNMFGREKVLVVFTNQVRMNIGGGLYGPKYVVPGGKAIPFHASVRVSMRSTKKIKDDNKNVVGARLRPHIVKNRMAPPERTCEFDLYFNSGIDDIGSWFDYLKEQKIIKHKAAGWYNIWLENPETGKRDLKYVIPGEDDKDAFRGETEWPELIRSNEQFRDDMFDLLSEDVLVKYNENWVDRSKVQYVDVEQPDSEDEE